MPELLTAAAVRAREQAAIAQGSVTGLALMERAGAGVVQAILAEWPDPAPGRALVLCGPGNNGGDGFVVARLLHARGWQVQVLLYGDPARLPPDAAENLARWRILGAVVPLDPAALPPPAPGTVVVDALFGTGLTRPLPDALARALHGLGVLPRGVAVDVPSGLCADSGRVLGGAGGAFRAVLTVTFHAAKAGHLLAEGPGLCGRLVITDIGLPAAPEPGLSQVAFGPAPAGLGKAAAGHKFSHGHALVLSGPSGRGGAARLAARGALRIGAGLVTVGAPAAALAEHAAQLNAIMLRPVDGAAGLAAALEDRRINALCLGPGLGTGAAEAGVVAAALALTAQDAGRGAVLDADALTLLAGEPALFAALHGGGVLTPHAGEFARLFPAIAAKLAAPAAAGPAFSKVDATRAAAELSGAVVLFKGPDTVIADPSGRAAVHAAVQDRAAPWLATAGAGDVLAGFICGLMARGFPPFDAACLAARLHVDCALSFGPGLIAEDLSEELPRVFRALRL